MQQHTFNFSIGSKEDVIIVLLFGSLDRGDLTNLDELENILKSKSESVVILNFRDINKLTPAVYEAFARFQRNLRNQKKKLALCSIHPEIRRALDLAGIIRAAEVFNNIPDAFQKLKA